VRTEAYSAIPDFNPEEAGHPVRLRDNPGKSGVTTGKTMQVGPRLLVQVYFGPNEKQYKPLEQLELQFDQEDPWELLQKGSFSQPHDLRRLLTFEKLKGDLTNIFYSMESSNTDFYAHQFKPVLKFIESTNGRLLIADEVGLGKTIEAVYIWRELQVREGAERLLIVCPSMLREKWQGDLRLRFGLEPDIVTVKSLLSKLKSYRQNKHPRTFNLIVSIEGTRPPAEFRDPEIEGPRAELARLLEHYAGSSTEPLFDLVIIDEAHYLRNPETANHKLGHLLREASRHLLLLTATPIQTESANLFQLLKLVDPDEFCNEQIFADMLEANKPILAARRNLWRQPPDLAGASASIQQALGGKYFRADSRLHQLSAQLSALDESDHPARVRLGKQLEDMSLLGRFLTRSLKREVLQKRVTRVAQTIFVPYTDLEQWVYQAISNSIRKQASGKGLPLFRLVSRQRQMASCLAAALRSWRETGMLEELFWEDYGLDPVNEEADGAGELEFPKAELEQWLNLSSTELMTRLAELERFDTKYNLLRDFLRQQLSENPGEKFVLFAFFRGTLRYLQQRLSRDGIPVGLILGGMGEAKQAEIRNFRRPDGPNVLLSSEVGSEGIDLQFCRFLINYDLPWNPMRVEQRIGRLDRLGQKAEKIVIINFALGDTVEERILQRLYERIRVFEESIGDLEEILGVATQELLYSLFDPKLTAAEREHQAMQTIMAVERQRDDRQELERDAINLFAFSDYLLDTISTSRQMGRLLHPSEVVFFIQDFFRFQYPGTEIRPRPDTPGLLDLTLSGDARVALQAYVQKHRPSTPTRLHQATASTPCLFDFRTDTYNLRGAEVIHSQHPLLAWIRAEYEKQGRSFHRVAAIKVSSRHVDLPPGDYAFVIHEWTFQGLRRENRLVFQVRLVHGERAIDEDQSEIVLAQALVHGKAFPNVRNVLGDLFPSVETALACESQLIDSFEAARNAFQSENESRCNVQEQSARSFAERHLNEIGEQLRRFREEGKTRVIPMTEGRLRRIEEDLQVKLRLIQERRAVQVDCQLIALGLLSVSEPAGVS